MVKNFKTMTLIPLLTGLLCFGLWFFPSQAEACCVYNHTIHPLVVDGSGIFWTIAPSNKDCTNGTGGIVSLYLMGAFRNKMITHRTNIEVDDHGWISVYKKSDGKWKIVSKKKDGSIKDVRYLKPGQDHFNPEN